MNDSNTQTNWEYESLKRDANRSIRWGWMMWSIGFFSGTLFGMCALAIVWSIT